MAFAVTLCYSLFSNKQQCSHWILTSIQQMFLFQVIRESTCKTAASLSLVYSIMKNHRTWMGYCPEGCFSSWSNPAWFTVSELDRFQRCLTWAMIWWAYYGSNHWPHCLATVDWLLLNIWRRLHIACFSLFALHKHCKHAKIKNIQKFGVIFLLNL